MSTSASKPANLGALIGPIVAAGLIIAVLRQVDTFIIYTLLLKVPYLVAAQYIASGLLGLNAFAGGLGTALLGLLIHLVNSLVIAAVFILAAAWLPVVRRNLIVSGLVYGVGVYIVMNFIVIPLSATPPADPLTLPYLVETIIGHAVLIGLPLAFFARGKAGGM